MGHRYGNPADAWAGRRLQPPHYCTALVCEAGHMITDNLEDRPAKATKHCAKCGAPTISKCPACETSIHGAYKTASGTSVHPKEIDRCCYGCGKPYPWTAAQLQAARELADELEISDVDRQTLRESVEQLAIDGPRTELAATRVKKILARAGGEGVSAFRAILVDIVSEVAKRTLFGS